MTLVLLIAIVGLALILTGVAAWELWVDHEAAKAESEANRRVELESCLRHHPPQASSFDTKAPKGGPWRNRRAS